MKAFVIISPSEEPAAISLHALFAAPKIFPDSFSPSLAPAFYLYGGAYWWALLAPAGRYHFSNRPIGSGLRGLLLHERMGGSAECSVCIGSFSGRNPFHQSLCMSRSSGPPYLFMGAQSILKSGRFPLPAPRVVAF